MNGIMNNFSWTVWNSCCWPQSVFVRADKGEEDFCWPKSLTNPAKTNVQHKFNELKMLIACLVKAKLTARTKMGIQRAQRKK